MGPPGPPEKRAIINFVGTKKCDFDGRRVCRLTILRTGIIHVIIRPDEIAHNP
jgi:hypothetical protein